ncbi:MAG: glycosyltransferase family 4 protein [Candidatus Eisenbacteria bacterium]
MKIAMIGIKGVPATWGGMDRIVEAMGQELVNRGHEVTVYCRSYYVPDEISEHKGIKLIRTPTINSKHLDVAVHSFTSVMDCLRRDFDIIHFHSIPPAIFCGIPRLFGKKTIVQVHGLGWTDVTWGPVVRFLMKAFEYPAIHWSNAFATVSEPAVKYFEETYGKRVEYVTSTTEFHEPRKPDKMKELGLERDGYILFVARLTPQKGLHYLLEAFKHVKTDKKLVIAGDVDPGDGLADYVADLRAMADSRTQFLGWVYEDLLDELYTNAFLFVLPSETEGLSVSLIEAINFGCGVLVSDIPENLDALKDYGFSFKNMDVADLTRTLQHLVDNPALVLAKRDKGREYVRQRYGIGPVVDSLERVYGQMLKSR